MWKWIIPVVIVLITIIRVTKRGFFWKARDGTPLTFKQFLVRWRSGIESTSPLQQTRITLWSFPMLVGGIIWGIVITLMTKTYWMALILIGSLPITSIQILSTWQKYQRLKLTEQVMKEVQNG